MRSIMPQTITQSVSAVTLAAGLCWSAQASAQAPDAHALYTENCTKCHGTEVYTRDNRRVTSFGALQSQVAMCDANLGTKLFPEDLELLVEHLNTNFYRFSD